ncbi:MAG TPA: lasso RiPP family leader peptide-containing protein [Thermoanaerobaculia bacterium]|nr:lasso RiPP family leader peptide-containing protein [Thermoanaerobaculia bacterium]
MSPSDDRAAESATGSENPPKKKYAPPKIERLGTIGELTRGLGQQDQVDGGHPPGQNKSIITGG